MFSEDGDQPDEVDALFGGLEAMDMVDRYHGKSQELKELEKKMGTLTTCPEMTPLFAVFNLPDEEGWIRVFNSVQPVHESFVHRLIADGVVICAQSGKIDMKWAEEFGKAIQNRQGLETYAPPPKASGETTRLISEVCSIMTDKCKNFAYGSKASWLLMYADGAHDNGSLQVFGGGRTWKTCPVVRFLGLALKYMLPREDGQNEEELGLAALMNEIDLFAEDENPVKLAALAAFKSDNVDQAAPSEAQEQNVQEPQEQVVGGRFKKARTLSVPTFLNQIDENMEEEPEDGISLGSEDSDNFEDEEE